ncbi:cytochrome c3 family protein [Rhodovulum sp. DZ06]|uniref:cytochrome c3 family protein n=1 Tax=Rhodovulum sp. DZ06 TaxID=3425126 RepID=UPI003D3458C7
MRNALLWILWLTATLLGAGALGAAVFLGGDRSPLAPGETTGVHHQVELACETCHAADPWDDFADSKAQLKDLNKTCRGCHDDELKVSNDSHPRKKFRDPRMADYWAKIDARDCTSCHVEHAPEITRPMGVTLAEDFCVACHSEGDQDVRVNRPSHAGLGFDTCASAGCHNFHDNRAIYEDFLVKHADEPWLKDHAVLPLRAARLEGGEPIAKIRGDALTLAQADAPAEALERTLEAQLAGWEGSAHAAGGVNCAGCHAPKGAKKGEAEKIAAEWDDAVEIKTCAKCHRSEAQTFTEGRHGMAFNKNVEGPRKLKKRLKAVGLKGMEEELPAAILAFLDDPSPEDVPMQVSRARVALAPDAPHDALTCASCHDPHTADTQFARVEACASCHVDDHSRAYFDSPHYALFQAEAAGEGAPGSGVGCADCHMPRLEHPDTGQVFVTHNQNETLRPNEKMIRPTCLSCHGLGFSIDALADAALVRGNFAGKPSARIESIDWAVKRVTTEGSRQ